MSFYLKLKFLIQRSCLCICILFLCISCKNLSINKDNKLFQKVWIKETIQESFKYPSRLQSVSPALAESVLVQGNKSTGLYAYGTKTGKQKWFFPIKNGVAGGVLLTANRVFFSGSDGFFYSLNLQTAQIVWKYYTGIVNSSSPVLHKGVIYFSSSHRLYALSAHSGKNLWTYGVTVKDKTFIVEGIAPPLVTNNKVYFKPANNSVVALNLKGKLKWQKKALFLF